METDRQATTRASSTFIHDFVVVDRPVSDVVERLTTSSNLWANGHTTQENEHILRLRAGDSPHRFYLAKDVRVLLGNPRLTSDATVVSLDWEGAESAALYPRMQGDVEFVALLPSMTEVTFIGSYRPPAGVIGSRLDRVLFRYVAESSVRSFLADLGTTAIP